MDSPEDGISIKPMKLKVLYTFDTESKNNCLARWPNTLEVRTAYLDNALEIGIIDLKTCIQAITSSSPELISKLDQDYTIYAYDYSEPDTPLVGQGLLSWALSSNTQENDSEVGGLVTGRVTRGLMGLFARNAQETLEVKLRLTPIPSSTQNDYLNSLQRYKEASGVIGHDFDAQAWTNFIQSNPNFMSTSGRPQSSERSTSPMDRAGLESVHRMLSEGVSPAATQAMADPFTMRPGSRPGSRSGTPQFNAPVRHQGPSSRPSSRGGVQPMSLQRRESFNSGYYSAEETFDEGPSKKRAKITKVDWPTKSNLNIERQPESLRVAASTASSVRIHRPIAVNPAFALNTSLSNEEPVRPPTPIPKSAGQANRRARTASTNLRRESELGPVSPSINLLQQPVQQAQPSIFSPEDTRVGIQSQTPPNIPSSPPVIPAVGSAPTSPALPPFPGDNDSGFMSGTFDDIFDDGNLADFDAFIDADGNNDSRVAMDQPLQHDGAILEVQHNIDPSLSSLSQPLSHNEDMLAPEPIFSRAHSTHPVAMTSPNPLLPPALPPRQFDQQMQPFPPQVPASDPVRTFHRSNTWAGDMSDVLTSDAPTVGDQKARPKKRVGKEQTKARLETAIAQGEMPPFCENCGAIETPAWRRAFARTFDCPYDHIETSLHDNACVFKEVTEHNEDGSVKLFKGYKISRAPEDREDQWVAITLCNPCGLWFHKQKCMRPPEKWNKGPKDPNQRRKRRGRPRGSGKKQTNGSGTKSDSGTPASDASSPQDTATEAAEPEEQDNGENMEDAELPPEPELPPVPKRATSAEPIVAPTRQGLLGTHSRNQLQRTRSSPLRPHGSETAPIEVDLTPEPLRRQLFSPPKQNGSTTSSTERVLQPLADLPNFVRRSPRLNKSKDVVGVSQAPQDLNDKENINPGRSLVDDLFEDGGEGFELPPTTPTPTRRSDRLLLKTPASTPTKIPGRTPGAHLSPNLRLSSKRTTRHPAAAALLGANKNVASMTPFTKQIHRLLSDAGADQGQSSPPRPANQRTPRKPSPKNAVDFDFPDLPSLHNSSPMSRGHNINFDFSELTTEHLSTDFQDMPSTDMTMPSSPPPGFFGFIGSHDDGTGGLWGNMDFGQGYGALEENSYPGPAALAVGVTQQGVRRSPRKR